MLGRLRDVLRRRPHELAPRQLRPNELRLEVVRADRLRREALQAQAATPRLPDELEELQRPRTFSEESQPAKQHRPNRIAALTSRSGLRHAWLAREILGPPLALRPRDKR
jgi:hypothetical protein